MAGQAFLELGDPGDQASTAQLTTEDLDQLRLLVNGPALRLALADEQPCETTNELEVVVDLSLDGDELEKDVDVAGCLSSAKPVGACQALLDLVRKY